MEDVIKKANVLIEALPYIKKFHGKTVVIKYGGAAMTDTAIRRNVLEDVVLMSYVGMHPILVHGGGPVLSERMKTLKKESKFVRGFRVTDEETMAVAEEAFLTINREIVSELTAHGGSAITLNGKDDRFIEVQKHPDIDGEDIGYVGLITNINADVLRKMLASDIIPVIPPLGTGEHDGHAYNINADQVAAEVAVVLGAEKLALLTNVGGIMTKIDDPSTRISHIALEEIQGLIESGVISGGMIPKINACKRALEGGVGKTHIIDAKIPHGLLLEIFTDEGIGTELVKTNI